MDLTPGGEADLAGDTIAEAAYSYTAGSPDTETARRYGRSFSWTCGSCEALISDHGLCNGPADDERGHADDCARLATEPDFCSVLGYVVDAPTAQRLTKSRQADSLWRPALAGGGYHPAGTRCPGTP